MPGIRKDQDKFSIYLEQIKRRPLVSPEEEIRLARRIREGDEEAKTRLIEANLRFVIGVASNYQNQGLPLPDLVNAGNIGLIKAAKRFDPDKSFKFISYAVWWIRQSILQELAENSRIVRIPLNKATHIQRVRRERARLQQDRQTSYISDEDLAEHLDIKGSSLQDIIASDSVSTSLDKPMGSDGRPLMDFLSDENGFEDFSIQRDYERIIEGLFSCLKNREKKVVEMYYGLNGSVPHTLEEIGIWMDLTRERIRQLRDAALIKLRNQAKHTDIDHS